MANGRKKVAVRERRPESLQGDVQGDNFRGTGYSSIKPAVESPNIRSVL